MSSTPSSRKGASVSTKKKVEGAVDQTNEYLSQLKSDTKQVASKDWDYKLALLVITVFGFATRFYAITHPNQVVFDEVHFGKVCRGKELPRGRSS
jgi:dolichyl-phosphate-mannose-protein mannosyltransferase